MAGTLIGIVEAVYVLAGSATGEYVALFYGAVLYALIGVCFGAVSGVLLALVGLVWRSLSVATAWVLGFLAVLVPLGMLLARRWVSQVIFDGGALPSAWQTGGLAGFGVLVLVALWIGPIFLTRTPLKVLPTPRGTAAAWGAVAALVAIFSFAPGNGGGDGVLALDRPATAVDPEAPDIVLIVVDSLRADRLGTYGLEGSTTPRIDALARQGVVFEQAIAQSTATRASFAALFTGELPARNGCLHGSDLLADPVQTLAEVLSEAGYATGGLPGDADLTRAYNLQQGFDWYSFQQPRYRAWATPSATRLWAWHLLISLADRWPGVRPDVEAFYQPAEHVLAAARIFVEANRDAGNRYFLMVHLMDPHPPMFLHEDDGTARLAAPTTDDERKGAYEGEVHWVDDQLGQFFDWMAQVGAWDDALVVVTADRGTELADHGGWWAGDTLYDEQLRVPVVVRLPGNELAGARVPWQVREIDVAPTLAVAAGAEPPAEWRGHDLLDADARAALLDLQAGDTQDVDLFSLDREAVAELVLGGSEVSAIRLDGWKYVRATAGGPRGLPAEAMFDLGEDPGEQHNLVGRIGPRHAQLSQRLRETIAEAVHQREGEPVMTCEECEQELLRGEISDCSSVCGS